MYYVIVRDMFLFKIDYFFIFDKDAVFVTGSDFQILF